MAANTCPSYHAEVIRVSSTWPDLATAAQELLYTLISAFLRINVRRRLKWLCWITAPLRSGERVPCAPPTA